MYIKTSYTVVTHSCSMCRTVDCWCLCVENVLIVLFYCLLVIWLMMVGFAMWCWCYGRLVTGVIRVIDDDWISWIYGPDNMVNIEGGMIKNNYQIKYIIIWLNVTIFTNYIIIIWKIEVKRSGLWILMREIYWIN